MDILLQYDELERNQNQQIEFFNTAEQIYKDHREIRKNPTIQYNTKEHEGACRAVATYFDKELEIRSLGTLLGLIAILGRNPKNEKLISTLNLFPFVERTYLNYKDKRRIQKNVCWVLCNFSISLKGTEMALKWIDNIMEIINKHIFHVRIQTYGCSALTKMNWEAKIKSPQVVAAALQRIEALFDPIDNKNKGVYSEEYDACYQIVFAYSDPADPVIKTTLNKMIETMKMHSSIYTLVGAGLKCINNVFETVEFNNTWVTVALDAMNQHADREPVIYQVCHLLFSCAYHVKYTIAQLNSILTTMAKFPNVDGIVLHVIGLFGVLTNCRKETTSKSYVREILKTKIVEFTIEAMKRFCNLDDILVNGCILLENMAYYSVSLWDISLLTGATDVVIRSLDRPTSDMGVYEKALNAIRRLAPGCSEALMKKEIIAKTLQIMTQHLDQVDLVSSACYVFTRFSALDTETKFKVAQTSKLISTVIEAMKIHKEVTKIQYAGSFTICMLCDSGNLDLNVHLKSLLEVHSHVVQQGGVEALVVAANTDKCKDKHAAKALNFIGADSGAIKGWEEKIAMELSKHSYETAGTDFGELMANRICNMLGLNNGRVVPEILSLETLAAKEVVKSNFYTDTIYSQLPDSLKEKFEFITKTIKYYNNKNLQNPLEV